MSTKERFEIDYIEANAGWINTVFKNGKNSLEIPISHLFDPFEDWFYALEGIFGYSIPSILIDTEGWVVRVDFIAKDNECLVKVTDIGAEKIVFTCTATKKEILEQMYKKLMDFVKSDRYSPNAYEYGSWSGFPLSKYQNKTIEDFLGKDNNGRFAICSCCGHPVRVMSLNDMLYDRVRTYIKNDEKLATLLRDLALDEYTMGVKQECSRKYKNDRPMYRCIQETESDIYFGFNEDFTVLDMIEISPKMFFIKANRGYKTRFNSLSSDEKLHFLEKAFSEFDSNLNGFSKLLNLTTDGWAEELEIALKMPNENVSKNAPFIYYPGSYKFPYFSFTPKELEGRLEQIRIILSEPKPINETISTWLHQEILIMQPYYQSPFLIKDGIRIKLEDLEGYDFKNHYLVEKFQVWQDMFDSDYNGIKIDWKIFNETGEELFDDLCEFIDTDYILVYKKSHEEIYDSINYDIYEQKEMFLRVWAEYESSGIWLIQKPFQHTAGVNVSYDYLGLPKELADEFKAWQGEFNKYIDWESNEQRDDFFAKGLELAKKLKEFLSHRAYVEFEGDVHVSIKYFYISADYDATLWDDEGSATIIELLCDELSIEYKNLKIFQKLLDDWGAEYEQKYLDGKLDIEKFNKDGQEIANELDDVLPKYCKIDYLKT